MFYFLQQKTTTLKDLLPYISVIVTILLFTTDRYIGVKIRRREVRRTWYLKILIEPNIVKLSTFFDNVGDAYERAATALLGAQGNIDYLQLKSINFEKFIDFKRQITANLIQPLTLQYFFVAESLTDKLTELEDLYTTNLDNELFTADNIQTFRLEAHNIKAKVLDILYTPLVSKTKNQHC